MESPESTRPAVIYCARCNGPFEDYENIAKTSADEFWHIKCFVCAQCFRPFGPTNEYFEFGGRKYCDRDFKTLFAPCCSGCNQYIIGGFVRALNKCWHPNCFLCNHCRAPLTDQGFIKSNNEAICHGCNILNKSSILKKHTCYRCKALVSEEEGDLLKFKDEFYHAYHFNCQRCGIVLDKDARPIDNDLYCLKCHDKMSEAICGACRRPIEERIVTALGKHFHVDHFVCATCEKPFLGKRHYEWKGSAYCQEHYYQLFGRTCFLCRQLVKGDVIRALDQYWCKEHFACFRCNKQLANHKSGFVNIDMKPCCKKCYLKLPSEVRRRCAEQQRLEKRELAERNP